MPPPTATPPAKIEGTSETADSCPPHGCKPRNGLFSGRGLAGLRLAHGENQVPSQQGPDYVSPQPKFHPVPVHPVFEPLLAYPPPQLIEVGGNPLRPSRPKGPGIFGGAVFIPAASRFSAKDSGSPPLKEPTPALPTPPPEM
jgi:hypothetical protein